VSIYPCFYQTKKGKEKEKILPIDSNTVRCRPISSLISCPVLTQCKHDQTFFRQGSRTKRRPRFNDVTALAFSKQTRSEEGSPANIRENDNFTGFTALKQEYAVQAQHVAQNEKARTLLAVSRCLSGFIFIDVTVRSYYFPLNQGWRGLSCS
jgi:hypothetical protein